MYKKTSNNLKRKDIPSTSKSGLTESGIKLFPDEKDVEVKFKNSLAFLLPKKANVAWIGFCKELKRIQKEKKQKLYKKK